MIVLLTAAQVPVFAGSEASAAGTIVSRDEYETPLTALRVFRMQP